MEAFHIYIIAVLVLMVFSFVLIKGYIADKNMYKNLYEEESKKRRDLQEKLNQVNAEPLKKQPIQVQLTIKDITKSGKVDNPRRGDKQTAKTNSRKK